MKLKLIACILFLAAVAGIGGWEVLNAGGPIPSCPPFCPSEQVNLR
jgi:hypothetical protein